MTPPRPLQRRAERRARDASSLDMNLVALIDIFTILIFFLLTSAAGIEILQTPREVRLPSSIAATEPRPTLVISVSAQEIRVDGRVVARVDEALQADGDLIAGLKAALDDARRAGAADGATPGAAAAAPAVTLMADQATPYRLLRKVMATAAMADVGEVSFAVQRRT